MRITLPLSRGRHQASHYNKPFQLGTPTTFGRRLERLLGGLPRTTSGLYCFPPLGKVSESRLVERPIMKSSGIKVSTVGPDQRVNFGINLNAIEQLQIPKWTEQLSDEDRPKIDRLLG